MGKLETLPFGEMSWEDFERIQWRVMRDVEGLRYAQIYGDRGQSQYGLDVVALAPDGSGAALQSKRYKRFGPAELAAAVNKFRTTQRPFEVNRFIIGVARDVKTTKCVETLAELRRELAPIALDLWDKQELSRLLRQAPEIVIEFFGMPTAEAFCAPFEFMPLQVPTADAVAVREALARTPEETTGAATLLEQAQNVAGDLARALDLVEAAQAKLRRAKFGGHAAQHDADRTRLLVELGRHDEAARHILDELWTALDQGTATTAMMAQSRLHKLAQDVEHGSRVAELSTVADITLDLYLNPLADVPEAERLTVGDPHDQLRLMVLAGETALSNDEPEWLVRGLPVLVPLAATKVDDLVLKTRLRLLVAEVTGDWSLILADARKIRLGHDVGGLVSARYARHCALNQRFEEADVLWDEAAGDACLAERWNDAATWTFSRRAFRTRWRPFTSDELLPAQTALREMGPARSIITADVDAHEGALEDLRRRKLRAAAISAQRALRDAVAASDWVAEERARRVLGEILRESDEPDRAARHFVRAGDTKALKELAQKFPAYFIDVTIELTALNYWTVGAAYGLLAEQADLVPDNKIMVISKHIMSEIAAAENGTLVDLRFVSTSRYLGALRALAGIAHRLTVADATMALTHFTEQPSVEPHQYRYHDEDEAIAVARIATSQPSLRHTAIAHLVKLLARSQTARGSTTERVIDRYIDLARADLKHFASQGNDWAQESLARHAPDTVSLETARAALRRLTTPLEHEPHTYTLGTGAIGDSLLIRGMTRNRIQPAVSELLSRANDPHVGSSDRGTYLLAASNLVHKLTNAQRSQYFPVAFNCAMSPIQSEQDKAESAFTHELGAMRIVRPDHDSRDRAVFLAASLATNKTQRREVKILAYALLGAGHDADYWATRALQQIGDSLNEEIGFLVGQGWALRSLAAIMWVKTGTPAHVGVRLADDPDVRVRRSFAKALAESAVQDFQSSARIRLAQDPCYSVRSTLLNEDSDSNT